MGLLPPAEGITLEYLFQPISFIFLQVITLVILRAISIQWPEKIAQLLGVATRNRLTIEAYDTSLKWLLYFSAVYQLNKWLSRKALNNWTTDKTWNWASEVVVLTGGSGGMGRLYVDRLASKGIKVAILDLYEPKYKVPDTARFFQTDITSPAAIKETATKIRDSLGAPTVLILNAGLMTGEEILAEKEDMFEKMYAVNTVSHFHLTREFLPSMIKANHGHIVTISSAAGFTAVAGNALYSATKAATISFVEGLAQELKHRYKAPKVRTSIVHPSVVRTPMMDHILKDPKYSGDFVLEPETVVDAVINQLLAAESAQIILPERFKYVVTAVRMSPLWLQEMIRDGQSHLVHGKRSNGQS